MEREWRSRLAAYDDGDVDAEERAVIERWLETDAEARAYLEALRRDRETFRAAFATVKARPDFTAAVMARTAVPEGWRGSLPRLRERVARLPVPRLMELAAAALFMFVIASLAAPGRRIEQARQAACQQSVKDLTRMVLSYTDDYDGYLPNASDWMVQVSNQTGQPLPAACPNDDGRGPSYAMPVGLSGAQVDSLSTPWSEVTVFDAEGPFLAPRHNRAATVGYLDGRVGLVPTSSASEWSLGER